MTLNGVGAFDADNEFQALFRGETRTLRLEYDASYDAVQISKSMRRPVGGTATFSVHVERTRERGARNVEAEFDIEAVATFASDGTAHLVLDATAPTSSTSTTVASRRTDHALRRAVPSSVPASTASTSSAASAWTPGKDTRTFSGASSMSFSLRR